MHRTCLNPLGLLSWCPPSRLERGANGTLQVPWPLGLALSSSSWEALISIAFHFYYWRFAVVLAVESFGGRARQVNKTLVSHGPPNYQVLRGISRFHTKSQQIPFPRAAGPDRTRRDRRHPDPAHSCETTESSWIAVSAKIKASRDSASPPETPHETRPPPEAKSGRSRVRQSRG